MKAFVFSLILFSVVGLQAKTSLRSLKDVSSHEFDLSKIEPALFLIFQKDCLACQKQVPQYSCLDIPIYLIGSFGTEKELRKEYKKLGRKYPAFLSNEKFLEEVGAKPGFTPQSILYANKKRFHFLGLTACEKISSKIKQDRKNG